MYTLGQAVTHKLVRNPDSRTVIVIYCDTYDHRDVLEAREEWRWPLSWASTEEDSVMISDCSSVRPSACIKKMVNDGFMCQSPQEPVSL